MSRLHSLPIQEFSRSITTLNSFDQLKTEDDFADFLLIEELVILRRVNAHKVSQD